MSIPQIVITNPDAPESDEEMEQKVVRTSKKKMKTKGRGFKTSYEGMDDSRYSGRAGHFESIEEGKAHVQKSVEGYIVFVSGVHDEAQEDDIYDAFADHGEIMQLHLNLDRRTGYVKGYALVEYANFQEANSAIENLNGTELLEQVIEVDWAFKRAPSKSRRRR